MKLCVENAEIRTSVRTFVPFLLQFQQWFLGMVESVFFGCRQSISSIRKMKLPKNTASVTITCTTRKQRFRSIPVNRNGGARRGGGVVTATVGTERSMGVDECAVYSWKAQSSQRLTKRKHEQITATRARICRQTEQVSVVDVSLTSHCVGDC